MYAKMRKLQTEMKSMVDLKKKKKKTSKESQGKDLEQKIKEFQDDMQKTPRKQWARNGI